MRGGSWNNTDDNLRCSARLNYNPDVRLNSFGFRVVRPSPFS
ncbi:SUMF1/EgtB/PvdO family nonheme iron enzyme [Chlorobium limicola]